MLKPRVNRIAYLFIGLDNSFNLLETKVYLEKPSLQSGDEWLHRLQHLFSTNKAENMSKAYHTVSQSICHRLGFGIPGSFFVVFIKQDVNICGYTYFIKCDDNVFVQMKNCFKCGVPVDPPRLAQMFQLAFLILWGKSVNYGR